MFNVTLVEFFCNMTENKVWHVFWRSHWCALNSTADEWTGINPSKMHLIGCVTQSCNTNSQKLRILMMPSWSRFKIRNIRDVFKNSPTAQVTSRLDLIFIFKHSHSVYVSTEKPCFHWMIGFYLRNALKSSYKNSWSFLLPAVQSGCISIWFSFFLWEAENDPAVVPDVPVHLVCLVHDVLCVCLIGQHVQDKVIKRCVDVSLSFLLRAKVYTKDILLCSSSSLQCDLKCTLSIPSC